MNIGALLERGRDRITGGAARNPLTGVINPNARDMVAQQMGQPQVGYAPRTSPPILPPQQSAPPPMLPRQPQPNYGDISAIMEYVQGRRAAPQVPMAPNVPPPKAPLPVMGK